VTRPLTGKLVRAKDLEMALDGAGILTVRARGARIAIPTQGLKLLDAFEKPTLVRDAVALLCVGGARDFIDATSTIASLVEAGILHDPDAPGTLPKDSNRWDATGIHVEMLRDELRTDAFRRAIEEVVRPGDVVVDIGTGSGVLAVFAARAGAKKVYAIEASSIAPLAAEVFQKSGVADRVEIVRGWSTQVELPERADVLVTETIGNEPLGERIVDTVFDARRRLLVPNARIIPSHVAVCGRLVSLSASLIETYLSRGPNEAFVRDRYGVDIGPLADAERRSTFPLCLDAREVKTLRPLSDVFTLADVDLAASDLVFQRESTATCTTPGPLEGVLLHFSAKLSAETTLTVDAFQLERSSWRSFLWIVPPRDVAAGDRVGVRYDHAAGAATVDLV
jgi:protein arginine N-methyltransferase 1